MASKGKERENFFRICILVVDHIKNALVEMFKYYLRKYKKNMSFEKFIDEHMADIKYLRKSRNLYQEEVDKLIVGDKAISGLKVDVLEVTLVRRLLDNLCPDLFMGGCKALHDFLKKNQHDIYHLFKFNERCCQCSHDYKFPVTSQLLQEDQYKKMFKSSPCTNCTGTHGTVCSGSSCIVTEDIKLDIKFNYKIKKVVFGHFSHIFKAMLKFTEIRNKAYGHADATVITNVRYDVYKKDIEENIMVLARRCENEDQTRLALDDVQTRSYDETLCKQYMISLSEEVKRDIELMEAIGKNHQILQENSQMLQENSQILQESSNIQQGNSQILQENSNIQQENSQMLQENSQILQEIPQHLQKIREEIENLKVTKTKLTKDDQARAMASCSQESSSNNISTGNDQSGQGYQSSIENDAEPYISSVNNDLENKRDDQAGAMASFSQESSSNNISTGNDQSGQGYQSSIETDAEPYISSVNNDLENKRDIYDGVVLHAEDDRDAAIKFIRNMERENPDLNINIILYENLDPGTSELESPAKCFDSCRYVFVFVTHNFVKADLERFLSESATIETLTSREKKARLIPVKADKTNLSALAPLKSLKYYHYLETKESQQGPDRHFIEGFVKLINNGRKEYLVN